MPHVVVSRDGPVAILTITLPDQFMTDDTVAELNAQTSDERYALTKCNFYFS